MDPLTVNGKNLLNAVGREKIKMCGRDEEEVFFDSTTLGSNLMKDEV